MRTRTVRGGVRQRFLTALTYCLSLPVTLFSYDILRSCCVRSLHTPSTFSLPHASSLFLARPPPAGKMLPTGSHDQCLLTHPTSHCLYLCLSLHDLHSQAGSHLLLCLNLSAPLARWSFVELRANVCEQHEVCVNSRLYDACLSYVCVCVCWLETPLFCQPLSVLNSQAALNLPSPPSLLLSLFTTCVRLSRQVYFVLSLRLMSVRLSEWRREREGGRDKAGRVSRMMT